MYKIIGTVLNAPWTLIGFLFALICIPTRVKIVNHAIVFTIKSFWWQFGYLKGVRAANIDQVVLLGPKLDPQDLAHELVHVEQYMRYPFIYPFLYYYELATKGYRNNKFESEAYKRAGNTYGKI